MDVRNEFEKDCVNLLTDFFLNLQSSLSHLKNQDPSFTHSISRKFFTLVDIHIGHHRLLEILHAVFCEKKSKLAPVFDFLNSHIAFMRHFFFRVLRKLKLPAPQYLPKSGEAFRKKRQYIKDNFINFLSGATKDQLILLAQRVVADKLEVFAQAEAAAAKFDQMPGKKCVLTNSLFSSTWKPMFRALREKGWKTGGLFFSNVKESKSYGICTTSEIQLSQTHFFDMTASLFFLNSLKDSLILLSGEAFHFSNFHIEDTIILYSVMQSFASTIKARMNRPKKLFFLMYDGLKPISAGGKKVGDLVSRYYKDYIQSVDNIIYNSNDELFGQFVENAYGATARRLHFPRYSEKPISPKQRLSFGENNDEFHMVCITACIDGSLDGLRSLTSSLVREIVEQGVHFHYYNGDPSELIAAFVQSIQPEFRSFFHSHPVNRDQQALVEEIHQYHIGLQPSDFIALAAGISSLDDSKYQDGMQVYNRSTQPTSTLTYLSAGVPMLVTVGAEIRLAEEITTSITYSEFCNIKNQLKKMNLPQLCKKADSISFNGWVDNHIDELDQFLLLASSQSVSSLAEERNLDCAQSV